MFSSNTPSLRIGVTVPSLNIRHVSYSNNLLRERSTLFPPPLKYQMDKSLSPGWVKHKINTFIPGYLATSNKISIEYCFLV